MLGKLLPALKSAICLKERHAASPRTTASLVKLFNKWLSMTDEEKIKACGDERILAVAASELVALGCPASAAELKGWYAANRAPSTERTLEECHEHIKLNWRVLAEAPAAAWADLAVEALNTNPQKTLNVWEVIKVHQTLKKAGLDAGAESYKAKAKELFPLARYFA